MRQEQSEIERMRFKSVKKIKLELDHSENARKVAEANEICK